MRLLLATVLVALVVPAVALAQKPSSETAAQIARVRGAPHIGAAVVEAGKIQALRDKAARTGNLLLAHHAKNIPFHTAKMNWALGGSRTSPLKENHALWMTKSGGLTLAIDDLLLDAGSMDDVFGQKARRLQLEIHTEGPGQNTDALAREFPHLTAGQLALNLEQLLGEK